MNNIDFENYINEPITGNTIDNINLQFNKFNGMDSAVDSNHNPEDIKCIKPVAITIYGMVRTFFEWNYNKFLKELIHNLIKCGKEPYLIVVLELISDYPKDHNSIQVNIEEDVLNYIKTFGVKYKLICMTNVDIKGHASYIENTSLANIILNVYCHEYHLIMRQHCKALIILDMILNIEKTENISFESIFRLRTDVINLWLLNIDNLVKTLSIHDKIFIINDIFAFSPRCLSDYYFLTILFYLKLSRINYNKNNSVSEYNQLERLINNSPFPVINNLYQPWIFLADKKIEFCGSGIQYNNNSSIKSTYYFNSSNDIQETNFFIRYDKHLRDTFIMDCNSYKRQLLQDNGFVFK